MATASLGACWRPARRAGGGARGARARPAGYLLAAQNSDGGIGATPGLGLVAAVLGLGRARAGRRRREPAGRRARRPQPDRLHRERAWPRRRTRATSSGTSSSPAPPGLPATSFGGRNLVAELRGDIRRNGSVNNQTNWTSFAVLALRAAGVAPPAASLAWLVRQQDADGGFNFATRGGLSDVDDTGAALEALAGAGGVRGRAGAVPRGRLHPRPAGPRRRLPRHARRGLERPVDGVRRAGADRRRGRPELAPPSRARRRRSTTCAR